eukprot:jgi/Botrbrau1/17986/Bobra.0460s0002.1
MLTTPSRVVWVSFAVLPSCYDGQRCLPVGPSPCFERHLRSSCQRLDAQSRSPYIEIHTATWYSSRIV